METQRESSANLTQFTDIKTLIAKGQYTTFNKSGKSKVWDLYEGILDANGVEIENVVACKKCNNIFKLNHKNTSNLLKHKCYILTMHNRQNDEIVEVSVQTKKKCLCVATVWAVENCRSFKIIEESGLKKFATFLISVGAEYGKYANLDTLLPHRTTLSRNVGILYEKYFNEIKVELGKIKQSGYGVTTDIWADKYLKVSYLAVTIHYVKDGELKNRLLALRSMEGEKLTGEFIKLKVYQTLASFNCEINDKVVIVTNRSANMISAFRTCKHICCINDMLNSVVEKSVKETSEISELYNACLKLVNYFKKAAIDSNLRTTLKSFTPTRWNTSFYLFSSVGENWDEITSILKEKNEMQRINKIFLSSIDAVLNVLTSFEETSKMLEGEDYATLHWVYIYIHRLKKICSINENDLVIIKALKEKMSFYLNEIVLKNINIYHKIALFLFPPTNKLKHFTESEKNIIKMECKNLMRLYVENRKIEDDDEDDDDDDDNITSTSNISSFNSELLSDFVEEPSLLNCGDKIEYEIRLYANTDVEFHDDFNVLRWWNSRKGEFPLLHKVSCKLLATPASSAASERIFSKAKRLISEKRSIIGANSVTVNQIMFLHYNINQTHTYSELEKIYN